MRAGPQLAGAGLAVLAAALAGCVSIAPDAAALRAWEADRQAFAYRPAAVTLAGIVVTEFSWWRAPLAGWEHSRDLLDAAAGRWLGLPAARRLNLDNPDRGAVQRFLTRELPAAAGPDDLLVIYLGTHQLRDGRILLAGGDSLGADDLAAWLSALPQRHVLLADLCYAARLETAAWSPRTMRVYAAGATALAPEVRLRGTTPGVSGFFATTDHLVRIELEQPADRYSLFGYLLVHSLISLLARRPATVDTAAWWNTLAAEQARLAKVAPYHPGPLPVAANVQAWPLAGREPRPAPPLP